MVTRRLPEQLSGLETLCKNLWWCWNDNAKALFRSIDYDLWHRSGHNPMEILDKVSFKRYKELAQDEVFLARLNEVMTEFKDYMAKKSERTEPSVGYFCMEYGLDTSLKIYSGGLGILAGDYLKETSDMNVNLVAVGLLYRYGYFTQRLTPQGNQVAEYQAQYFLRTPAEPVVDDNGVWKSVRVSIAGRDLCARIWKVAVGRTDLYLLDTDYEDNIPEDRQVTHHLYGGDWENRLKQEILLGVGGVRALRALGLTPTIYHYNEGHAAFAGLERLRECMQERHLSFAESMELIRASGLFTTHTPVPAGHDAFTEELLGKMADLHIEVNALRSAKLSRLKDYLKRSIEGLDIIDDVKKYELLTKLSGMEDVSAVCHGEFMPENIIVNDKGMFVVDWFKAKQGNPLADAARTYLGFCLRHRTESAEKYLRIYCEKAGADPKKVREWLPIVAAAQLKFKRPEERELLLTWIDVADYL